MDLINKVISTYKIKKNDEDQILISFNKYAGLYMAILSSTLGCRSWIFLDSKETVIKCIKILKEEYCGKKAKNYLAHGTKKNDIFFDCPCCCPQTYSRIDDWCSSDETRKKMDEQGYLYTCEREVEWFGSNGKRIEIVSCNLTNDIGDIDDFKSQLECLVYSDKTQFCCDICDILCVYDNIHFCLECLEKKEFFNVCNKCIKKNNIDHNQSHNLVHYSTSKELIDEYIKNNDYLNEFKDNLEHVNEHTITDEQDEIVKEIITDEQDI